jgi:hypothetical protein
MVGAEGNEEMMLAGQAGCRHFLKHLADDIAQGILGQDIVPDKIFRLLFVCHDRDNAPEK